MGILKRLAKRWIPTPVLALRSHVLTRQMDRSFAKLDNAAAFGKIYRNRVWGSGDDGFWSGLGSHDEHTSDSYVAAIRSFLARFPRRLDVVDIGCGDFSVGSRIRDACNRYVAGDVVPELIERNTARHAALDVTFVCQDATRDALPSADVCFIRQVMQHLSNEQIAAIIPRLCAYEHLIVTEHLPNAAFTPNLDKQMGPTTRTTQFRPSGVVLTAPPFNLNAESIETLLRVDDGVGGTIETTHYFKPFLNA
jgi:hypothetical protein